MTDMIRERNAPAVYRSLVLLVLSLLLGNCNSPYQPEIAYSPKLNIYSVLFAKDNTVFVRLTSVAQNPSDVAGPVHGATVILSGADGTVQLSDTTTVVNGDTVSFYTSRFQVVPGEPYTVTADHAGYPTAHATVNVPLSFVTIPDARTYGALVNPKDIKTTMNFVAHFSTLASAEFIQAGVECRGLDSAGDLHHAFFSFVSVDSLNPFTEIKTPSLTVLIDTLVYQDAFARAKEFSNTMVRSHTYAEIIISQVDNNLYKYFVSSDRTVDPLAMRTDKIIFSNIVSQAGNGIVAGASIDTTRIFLF